MKAWYTLQQSVRESNCRIFLDNALLLEHQHIEHTPSDYIRKWLTPLIGFKVSQTVRR